MNNKNDQPSSDGPRNNKMKKPSRVTSSTTSTSTCNNTKPEQQENGLGTSSKTCTSCKMIGHDKRNCWKNTAVKR